MRRSLARWVSIVAHPFVTTLVLVAAVELRRGTLAAVRAVALVGLLFVAPVALLMVRQVRGGHWGHVDATDRRERPVLFAVGGACTLALLGYLALREPGSALLRGGVGTLGMLALCALLTRWIKLSLHMAAAALAATTLLHIGSPAGWPLAAVLPVLGWSRVALGRHSLAEVALGLAIGAGTALAIQTIP
jgi:hypothetical protein